MDPKQNQTPKGEAPLPVPGQESGKISSVSASASSGKPVLAEKETTAEENTAAGVPAAGDVPNTVGVPNDVRCRRRTMLWGLGILLFVLLPLLLFLNTLDFSSDPEEKPTDDTPFVPVTYHPNAFYTPEQIGAPGVAAVYGKMNRTVSYTFNGQTVALSESYAPDGNFSRFFLTYFSALQEGNGTAFLQMHSDFYRASHEVPDCFAPQRPYDIQVSRISEPAQITAAVTEADRPYIGCYLTRFEVRYKLYYNDGAIRRDIVDEDVIPLVFTLITMKDGTVLVNAQTPILQGIGTPAEKDPSGMPYAPLVGAFAFLVVSLVALVLSFLMARRRVLLWYAAASAFLCFLLGLCVRLPILWQILVWLLTVGAGGLVRFLIQRKKRHKNAGTEATTASGRE